MKKDTTRRGVLQFIGSSAIGITALADAGRPNSAAGSTKGWQMFRANTATTQPPEKEWTLRYDRNDLVLPFSVTEVTGDTYLLAGRAAPSDFSSEGSDAWLAKISADGVKQWDQAYGTGQRDVAQATVESNDGNYLFTGATKKNGTLGAWLVKVNTDGKKLYDKTYSQKELNYARSIIEASDVGYLLAGNSKNENGIFEAGLMKVNENGTKRWTQTYGNGSLDHIIGTSNSGYLIAGSRHSSASRNEPWLLKVDGNGTKQWSQTYGEGDMGDCCGVVGSVIEAKDGSYLFSSAMLDVGDENHDVPRLVKVNTDGRKQWDRAYNSIRNVWADEIVETSDGGYLLAGSTGQNRALVVKVDTDGAKQWEQVYSNNVSSINSIIKTSNGGYVLVGASDPSSSRNPDGWLMKLRASVAITAEETIHTVG